MIQNIFSISPTGKKVLLLAGIHGDEQTSIYTAEKIVQLLQKKEFILNNIKSITILNFINDYGIFNFTRQNDNDIDLNRQFSKQHSEQKIVQQIKKYISKNDVIIDLHCSFNTTQFLYLNNDKYLLSYLKFLKKYDLPFAVNEQITETVKNYGNNIGKIAFTLQMNQIDGKIDIQSSIKATNIIFKILNNINDFKFEFISGKLENVASCDISSDISGLMTITTQIGKYVKRNDILGYIMSLNKKRMINIHSPFNGKIIAFPKQKAYVPVGYPLIKIQPEIN